MAHRLPHSDSPPPPYESPQRTYENSVMTEVQLQCGRVAPLREWTKTYRTYSHAGNARQWALVALKAAIITLNHAQYVMSHDLVRERRERLDRVESSDQREEREEKDKHYQEIVDLSGSSRLLLQSFEAEDDKEMIEDRIKEIERVLLMIVGSDENGLLR